MSMPPPPGRNDLCPCGSGKKYKRCCGAADHSARDAADAADPGFASCWEVDLVPVPIRIGDEPTARPVLLLIVDADGALLQADVITQPPAEAAQIAELMAEYIRTAGRIPGGLPATMLVRHPAVAAALGRLPGMESVHVVARTPLPRLDEAARAVLGGIAHDRGDESEAATIPVASPETWAGWGLPRDTVAELFRAAAAYYRAAPWRHVANVQILHAELPGRADANDLARHPRRWTACILGNGGQEFGLSLYADPDDFGRGLGRRPGGRIPAFRGPVLAFSFNRRADVLPRMAREILAAGWEVADHNAYPHLMAFNTMGGGIIQAQAEDLTTLLRVVPRFVAEYRALLASTRRPDAPIRWRDRETDVAITYDGGLLPEVAMPWPTPATLSSALPTGPNADPFAEVGPEEQGRPLEDEDLRIIGRFGQYLEGQGMSLKTTTTHVNNAALFLEFLAMWQGVWLEACTEFDLRTFFYDWLHRKVMLSRSAALAVPGSLKRFFEYIAAHEGLGFPWAAAILRDRKMFAYRRDTFPGGFWWEPGVADWLMELTVDLNARVFLPELGMAEDGTWGQTMGAETATLRHELERHWLRWRDEVIASGVTDPGGVRSALVARQRAWETAPHPRYGGRSPVEVVREELAEAAAEFSRRG